MKVIKYTYKFKLDPNKDQQTLLNKHFGSVIFETKQYDEYDKKIGAL